LLFTWLILLFLFSTRINNWSLNTDSYAVRLYYYIFFLTKELRLQFEAMFQAIFFVFFYFTMMIITFDDDQEEILEFFNATCFYFFLFTLPN
jgi:hypothetical protein